MRVFGREIFFWYLWTMTNIWTIIVAGGAGQRMGAQLPKQFLELKGVPILVRTLQAFQAAILNGGIVVVLPAEHHTMWNDICAKYDVPQHVTAMGGATRFDSVKAGLSAVPREATLVAVHDGVRPFVSAELVRRACVCAEEFGSAIPVVRAVDSFRRVTESGSEIVDRDELRAVQTPQVFDAGLLRQAYDKATDGSAFTDDASVVEAMGERVCLVDGEPTNIKITTPSDLLFGEAIVASFEKRLL